MAQEKSLISNAKMYPNSSTFFKEMYTYYTSVAFLIKKGGGDKDQAKDIFQEALIILWEKFQNPGFTLQANPKTYLYGISKNLWNQTCKTSKRYTPLSIEHEEQLAEVQEEEKIDQTLLHILNQVSSACQQIFQAFYFQKLSMADIAKQLGYSSEQSAKTQKYKCIEKAREIAQSLTPNL